MPYLGVEIGALGQGLSDLGADDFSEALPESVNRHFERAFVHAQPRRRLGLRTGRGVEREPRSQLGKLTRGAGGFGLQLQCGQGALDHSQRPFAIEEGLQARPILRGEDADLGRSGNIEGLDRKSVV